MEPTNRTSGTSTAAEDVAHAQSARVFVALKIVSDLARELAGLSAGLQGLAVRRVAAADIHLTLVPPWSEPAIADAVVKLGRVAETHAPFELAFWHIGYGPEPRRPRFLWAECTANSELAELRATLLAAFGQTDERPFRPHVTLARIRGNGAAIARKHPIDRDLALSQRIVSVELMRSPPAGSRGYTVLASLPLGAAARTIEPRT
jgi:2'-5' RNA ligase